MIVKPWSAEDRGRILSDLADAKARRGEANRREDWETADALLEHIEQLCAEYEAGLPRFVMSCCPFDGKPLVRTLDPMGLDGLWWEKNASPKELPACPHFCLLAGAVNYQGLPARAGSEFVYPGPEVPFVYPRVLASPGMVAVISSLSMENGYLAYPIAYFAEKRPPSKELAAGWRRTVHYWKDPSGDSGWRIENDRWDFDLRPWLEQGKVRWTPPGSDRTTLASEPWDRCPYLDLPGQRRQAQVSGDKGGFMAPPDGAEISPYDD